MKNLELRMAKMEQIMKIKDVKMQRMSAKLQRAGLSV